MTYEQLKAEEIELIREKAREAINHHIDISDFGKSVTGAWEKDYADWHIVRVSKREIYHEEEATAAEDILPINELLGACGLSARRAAILMDIPTRTMYSWTQGTSVPAPWVIELVNYRLRTDPRYRADIEKHLRDRREMAEALAEYGDCINEEEEG